MVVGVYPESNRVKVRIIVRVINGCKASYECGMNMPFMLLLIGNGSERSIRLPGQPLQVVNVRDDHSFDIKIDDLEKVLLDHRVRDSKVVVVSVAGAFRKGKSFLLNFCLRYLQAEVGVYWLLIINVSTKPDYRCFANTE